MIKKSTLLVLGAGASAPYNYPTGKMLRNLILNHTLNTNSMRFYANCGFETSQVEQFIQSFKQSATASIDSFLEYRTEFIDIGKLAITKALIQFEIPDALYNNDDWYQYLFNKLTANVAFEQFGGNSLSIITFNYDRSLEYFLINSLQNLYGKSKEECWETLKKIPIVHVHGQMGYLPFQGKNPVRSYSVTDDPFIIKESSKSIRIIHEKQLIKDEVFEKAFQLIAGSENIYFLGFGYHEVNLMRLKIGLIPKGGREIFGTSHNLTEKERYEIEAMSEHRINLHPNDTYNNNQVVLDFLREHVNFK